MKRATWTGRAASAGLVCTLAACWAGPPPMPATGLPEEWTGALHIHTGNGQGTVAEVVSAARRAGLDFVVFAEHDERGAMPDALDGVVLVPGLELSTPWGHLLAIGALAAPEGGDWNERLEALAADGVFLAGAHPARATGGFTRWDAPWLHGVEVANGGTILRDAAATLPLAAPGLLIELPLAGLLRLLGAEDVQVGPWQEASVETNLRDVLALHPHLTPVAGTDAHGRWGESEYRYLFERVVMHVTVPPNATPRDVVAALRSGSGWIELDGRRLDLP